MCPKFLMGGWEKVQVTLSATGIEYNIIRMTCHQQIGIKLISHSNPLKPLRGLSITEFCSLISVQC